jgi:GAF domain-containing protein
MDVDAIRQLARIALADRPLTDVLGEITAIATEAVPGAEATGITIIRGSEAFTAAFTGQLALDADEMQYAYGYGPCMDAGRTGVTLLVHDMRTEDRWPDYAHDVARRGVLSSLSVPLPYQGSSIGALNLYATKPNAFDSDVEIGEEVAAYIAVAIANADAYAEASTLARNMQEAMHSRAEIEMAKGILMAQQHCTPAEAFSLLSKASQRSNRKLRDLARDIVANVVERAANVRGGDPPS